MNKTFALMLGLILLLSCVASGAFAENREVHLAIQPSAAFVPLVIARGSGWIDEAMQEMHYSVIGSRQVQKKSGKKFRNVL